MKDSVRRGAVLAGSLGLVLLSSACVVAAPSSKPSTSTSAGSQASGTGQGAAGAGSGCHNLSASQSVRSAVAAAYIRQNRLTSVQTIPGTFYYGSCGNTYYAATLFEPDSESSQSDLVALQDDGSVLQVFSGSSPDAWSHVGSDDFPHAAKACGQIKQLPTALASLWGDCLQAYDVKDSQDVAPPAGSSSITLGVAPPSGSSKGYGDAKPGMLDDGGDGSQVVTDVTWSSWGGSSAQGSGTGSYAAPDEPLADAKQEPVTLVASDPGQCDGHQAYRKLGYWFPNEGQTSPAATRDVCDWN